ncbi:ATP synthase mitochondrial F1 complex assembly factor 1 [Condylostylus longicornis]|uniref:ATP synthase mitochondrial F1 complex assembly factor 1 n=1 Tax=Condylostylus longicornis TaxID=2530218 RepID=UPI00244DAC48|nr:ATP synthase mitochondrial F1 complex assembly factor 1 [Condylostylus longicornis]
MACFRSFKRIDFFPTFLKRSIKMSAMLRAEEVLDEMKNKNPYYEKYASKIAKLQQTSPQEFLERVDKVSQASNPIKSTERNYSELLKPKMPSSTTTEVAHKKLSDIMKLELLEDKNVDDVKHIWLEYHKNKDVIAAVLTNDQYDTLIKRGKLHPVFLLPLPRSEGYEFIMLQFAANTVHFTPLLAYQVHHENAPECLNMIFYTEMKDKGLVLMRGEFDHQVLSPQEAQCLANELQLYYSSDDPARSKLLENFTRKPDSFKHMDLIKQLEEIELK